MFIVYLYSDEETEDGIETESLKRKQKFKPTYNAQMRFVLALINYKIFQTV